MSEIKKDTTTTCGTCGIVFEDDNAYLDHVCSVTGFTPRDPQHFGERFVRQSKKALERGKSLSEEKEKEINNQIEEVREKDIDHQLMTAALENKKK